MWHCRMLSVCGFLLVLLLHTTLLYSGDSFKPLHYVLKVNSVLLRNNIEFFENNFNFKIFRHEEFTSGCEATCNGIYGGPWSKTIIGLNSCDEANTFSLELISNYGIRSYEKGNEFRYLSVDKTYFIGSNDNIIITEDGNSFIKTPDGYYINLIEPSRKDLHNRNYPIQYISLHTTNLEESKNFYCNFLNAIESKTYNGNSMMTWGCNNIGIELIEYNGVIYRGTAHGRFAISTDKYNLEKINEKLKRFNYQNLILHGPVALNPHKEEVIIIKDFDGHEYCFVDNIGYQSCIDAGNKSNKINWDFRDIIESTMIEKVNQNLNAEYGENIKIWNSTMLNMFNTQEDTKDLLIEIHAPWCVLCQLRKPMLKNIASNIRKLTPDLIVATIDGSDMSNINPSTEEYLKTMLAYTQFQGYPQLFYIQSKKHPVAFEGEWKDNEIWQWIKAQSTLLSIKNSKVILQESSIIDDDCDSCNL